MGCREGGRGEDTHGIELTSLSEVKPSVEISHDHLRSEAASWLGRRTPKATTTDSSSVPCRKHDFQYCPLHANHALSESIFVRSVS